MDFSWISTGFNFHWSSMVPVRSGHTFRTVIVKRDTKRLKWAVFHCCCDNNILKHVFKCLQQLVPSSSLYYWPIKTPKAVGRVDLLLNLRIIPVPVKLSDLSVYCTHSGVGERGVAVLSVKLQRDEGHLWRDTGHYGLHRLVLGQTHILESS